MTDFKIPHWCHNPTKVNPEAHSFLPAGYVLANETQAWTIPESRVYTRDEMIAGLATYPLPPRDPEPEPERSKMVVIPKGSYLTVTTGEYSDYDVQGVFRALQDIDAEALREEWLGEYPGQQQDYHFRTDIFLGWVVRKGIIDLVPSYEWHLDSYGCVDAMGVAPPKGDDE